MFVSLHDFITHVRFHYPAQHAFLLRLGDCVIEVRVNSTLLKQTLCEYFHSFLTDAGPVDILITAHEAPTPELDVTFSVKPPEAGKSKIKEEWVDIDGGRIVRKRLTGMVMAFGSGEHLAVGPCLENPNQVINFINNRFIERMLVQGCILGHAAGVALGERGLALAGFSGMGKSTLALHVMSLGADFISNDRVLIRNGADNLWLYGVAKHPRINPGTALHNPDLMNVLTQEEREKFQDLPPGELWTLEHKYDALIEECFGAGRFRLKAMLAGVVLLNWRREAGPLRVTRINAAQRTDLLPAIMKSPGLFYPSAELREVEELPVRPLIEALARCPVFEFSGGVDFEAAARACQEILHTGRTAAEDAR